MIDLSAFGMDSADQLTGAIELRGAPGEGYVVINLTEFGGGRITIEDVNDLDTLDLNHRWYYGECDRHAKCR